MGDKLRVKRLFLWIRSFATFLNFQSQLIGE